MADLKISQLTGATTPLAGTEVLPIVQSSSTKKVSVANLTVGRAVDTAGGTFTDNQIQGTAAKGVNFTANTPAAGMTSQLLNWYEEGTFTPTVIGTTSAGTATYSVQVGQYTRIGNRVFFQLSLAWTAHTGTGNMQISGLPFTSNSTANNTATLSVYSNTLAMTAGNVLQAYIPTSNTVIVLDQVPTGGGVSGAVPLDTDVSYFIASGQYQV